jgi:hypothetical protein
MVSQRLIKLYYDKLKKPTIMHGLVLHPFMVDNKLKWEVENPNDVSFASNVVEGHLEEMLYNFLRLAGVADINNPSINLNWSELSRNYCKLTESDVHINRDLSNKINQKCDRLNVIKLIDDETLTADCYVRDWSIEYPDTEALYVHVALQLSNPQIIGEDNEPKEIDDDTLSQFIEEFRYNETSQEQETDLLYDIIVEINNQKNMFDDVYMFSMGLIEFYDNFGNKLG